VTTSKNTNELITSSSSYHYTNHFGILMIHPLPPSFVAAVQPGLKHTPLYLPPAAQQVILGGQWQGKTVVRQPLLGFGGTSHLASVHHHGMTCDSVESLDLHNPLNPQNKSAKQGRRRTT
jgi:hypothetical protein